MSARKLAEALGELDSDQRSIDLIEAASQGSAVLNRAIEGEAVTARASVAADTDTKSVYLSSIGVEGFRGIGPKSTLFLTPGPGLTLVVGRNGSGKSSFAEGLEMLMTGSNLRWEDRSAQWQNGWRNLHAGEHASVQAEFAVEGRDGAVTSSRSWAADAELDESQTSLDDPAGEWTSLDHAGWNTSLDSHRPFLSYNELGSMLEEKPSDLYDAMSAFLGLDDLLAAQDLLRKSRLEYEKPAKEAKSSAAHVVERLETSNDPRAMEAAEQIKGGKPDLDSLRSLANTSDGANSELDRLRSVANLSTPDQEGLLAAADDLESALTSVVDAAETSAGRAERLERLLLAVHEHMDDENTATCPVCKTEGVLTESWRAESIEELEDVQRAAQTATQAKANLDSARKRARTAIVACPHTLSSSDGTGVQQSASAKWTEWAKTPGSDTELIARLRAFAPVEEAVLAVKAEASAVIKQRDLTWGPHARAIANWIDQRDAAAQAAEVAKEVGVAEKQLKSAIALIRDERFGPIECRSRELWGTLRHQSNVQLQAIELEGTNNSRRVSLQVTVDGEESVALGVMSQGELHALALSLFLPRATMEESPFRFVMIDDPVQAMDPARVDGLARVLEQVAKTHQVVVFTHDDRLPESVRRLQIPAEVTEVTRQPGSKVSTRPTHGPVKTAISDAFAVAKTEQMAMVAKQKVVPNYCRMAVEAAAATVVKRRLLTAGQQHHEVERILADEKLNLRRLVAFAIFGDENRGRDVNGELKARCDTSATWAMHHCNAGSHGNFEDDPVKLAKASEKLANWLLEAA